MSNNVAADKKIAEVESVKKAPLEDSAKKVQFKDDNEVFQFDETIPSNDHYIPGIAQLIRIGD